MLKFLGSGGAFSVTRGNNCAYLELGTELFFFDLAPDAVKKIIQKKLWLNKTRVNIFLTHMHGDHIGGLATFVTFLYETIYKNDSSRINIYFPSNTICQYLDLQGVPKEWYNFFVNKWDETEVDGIKKQVEYVFHPVSHVKELERKGESNSYGIEFHIENDKSFYYSGDTNDFADILSNFHAFDYIYHETTLSECGKHMNYQRLLELTKDHSKEERGKLYLMHLDDEFDANQARNDGFHVVENEE